jgi:NAD(P)H-dependent flavin oxidoreductase YrpB (nitropropane dioxygenase family)
MLHTPLCTLLGIEFPIIQAGMGAFTSAALAAAVSNAGGWAVWAPSSGLSRTCPSSLPVCGQGPGGPLP